MSPAFGQLTQESFEERLTAKEPRKKLELILTESNPCSSYNSESSSEPGSPDSGFSSDDYSSAPLPRKLDRSQTLPSAIRRARSRQCQKRVRFADALGLDLEKLQIFSTEEQKKSPFTPPSALTRRITLPNFVYCSEFEFNNKTRDANICVSSLRAAAATVIGQVNVVNLAFDKVVTIRFTDSNWLTFTEHPASYSHSTSGIDIFNFSITLPVDAMPEHCEFCVCYSVADTFYWDNNRGMNYHVDIVKIASQTSITPYSSRSARRSFTRRWGRNTDDSDEEPMIYVPRRKGF